MDEKSNMNLSVGWGFKYLLLLQPRHFVGTNPATFTTTTFSGPKPCYFCYHAKCKLNIIHERKGGVGVEIPATFATTTYNTNKRKNR